MWTFSMQPEFAHANRENAGALPRLQRSTVPLTESSNSSAIIRYFEKVLVAYASSGRIIKVRVIGSHRLTGNATLSAYCRNYTASHELN